MEETQKPKTHSEMLFREMRVTTVNYHEKSIFVFKPEHWVDFARSMRILEEHGMRMLTCPEVKEFTQDSLKPLAGKWFWASGKPEEPDVWVEDKNRKLVNRKLENTAIEVGQEYEEDGGRYFALQMTVFHLYHYSGEDPLSAPIVVGVRIDSEAVGQDKPSDLLRK